MFEKTIGKLEKYYCRFQDKIGIFVVTLRRYRSKRMIVNRDGNNWYRIAICDAK